MNSNRHLIRILTLSIFQCVMAGVFLTGCPGSPAAPPPGQPEQTPPPGGAAPGPGQQGPSTTTQPTQTTQPVVTVPTQTTQTPPIAVTGPPTDVVPAPEPIAGTTPPTEVVAPPEPMMKSAEALIPGLMAQFSFNFGIDKPLLDYDRKLRKGATLKLYLGVKPAEPVIGNQLVLIAPALKEPFSNDKVALRSKIFESSEYPDAGLKELVLKHLHDATFEKPESSFDPIMQYKTFKFSKLGQFKEFPLYATGEQLTLPSATLTEEKDIKKKAEWEKILRDHYTALNEAFLKFNELEKDIVPADLKGRGKRQDDKEKPNFGPTVESLIMALERLRSTNVDINPQSVHFALKPYDDEVSETNFLAGEASSDKFLVGKNIMERALAQVDETGDRCRKKWEEHLQKILQPGLKADERQRHMGMAYIYEEFCEIPILYFKDYNKFGEIRDWLAQSMSYRGLSSEGTLDVYAKRAIAYFDKLLATLIPTTPPPEFTVPPPTDLPPELPTTVLPEPPKMPPLTVKKPERAAVLPPPPTLLKESALQKPIDEQAKTAGLLASKKIPFGYDARELPPNTLMSEEVRKLSFHLGVKGTGPKKEDAPYKLYVVGPKLVDDVGNPLDIKANNQRFFDSTFNPIYPLDKVPDLKKDTAPKVISHEGQQQEVAAITELPEAELMELYDQSTDGAVIRERDAQVERLQKFNTNITVKDKIQETKQELKKFFGELDVTHEDFYNYLNRFHFSIASRVMEYDIFARSKVGTPKLPWREEGLSNLVTKLAKHADVLALQSKLASSEASSSVVLLKERFENIKATCVELKDSVVLKIGDVLPIINKKTIEAFQTRGCKEASVDDDPNKGPVSIIRVRTAKACLKQLIEEQCVQPADNNLRRLKDIEDTIVAQTQAIDQTEADQRLLVALEDLIKSLTKKYQTEKPQKSLGETLIDELTRRRQALTEDPEEDETWDED